jgi:hypothetical protein
MFWNESLTGVTENIFGESLTGYKYKKVFEGEVSKNLREGTSPSKFCLGEEHCWTHKQKTFSSVN